jgi:aspartate aminotransferase-like enzyme
MKRWPHLMAPGPTPVPPTVALAMAGPAVHHRTSAFKELTLRVHKGLQAVFQTTQPVLLLTGSGTMAMEAAVCNLLSKGDEALFVNGGKFGERWGKLLDAYGCRSIAIQAEWGQPVAVEAVRAAIEAHPTARALFVQAAETSTATSHPLTDIAALVRSYDGKRAHDLLLVVDGITALGVDDLPMDALGVDVFCGASQKAFMLPPGLAFIALSERAWAATARSDLPKFYLDLQRERKNQVTGATAFTPATSLVFGLEQALQLIANEGLHNTFARHARLAAATRAGVQALGMTLCSAAPSTCTTGCFTPPGVDADALRKAVLQHHDLFIAGGQDQWQGKILRIGHLGYFFPVDILATLGALETELLRMGHPAAAGASVAAAAAVFAT